MPHFFISYSKKDTRELALRLNDALNALPNVTAWVDKSIKVGESWEIQIQNEIDRCDYMIVLYSRDINRHKQGEEASYILREIHYAKRIVHKRIIPVMAQPTEPPLILVMEQYIDFTLPGLRLDDLVKAILEEASVEPSLVASSKRTSLTLMPEPFAWIHIPGKGYNIAKYPVTNAQFAKFVESGGYKTMKWWTNAGWDRRQREYWNEPLRWFDAKWNGAEQPVVGLSWYEAVAFCLWLSSLTGENISLPTEDQWEYAAQGSDGRAFPWGNQWDGSRCNHNLGRKGLQKTAPVRQFEGKGDSPFRVVDMTGNVWEWCLDDYSNRTYDINSQAAKRSLRGGSYDTAFEKVLRCDARNGWEPHTRDDNGFRIVRNG